MDATAGTPAVQPTNRRAFEPREAIYVEGDPVTYCYEVVAGAVSASKVAGDGRRQVVEFHLPGDLFGFDGPDGVHALSAEAVAPGQTVVTRHSRQRIDAKAAADAAFATRLAKLAFRSLARAQARLLLLGRTEAAERVAAFLLEMQERLTHAPDGTAEFDLPMSRDDIADHLGTTRETVSRMMQGLQRRGVIALSGRRRVRILDQAALHGLGGMRCAERPSACRRIGDMRDEQVPPAADAWAHLAPVSPATSLAAQGRQAAGRVGQSA